MIIGTHSIIYSKDPETDRAFFRDVLGLNHIDLGGGWLVFELPPSELAFHPAPKNDVCEFYLMTDDIEAFVADVAEHDVSCSPVKDEGWGLLVYLQLPGGGKLRVYEPKHERPEKTNGD